VGLLQNTLPVTGHQRQDASEAEKAVIVWTDALLDEARAARDESREWQDLPRYLDYIAGKQWSQGRQAYQSSPVINRFWNLFWEKGSNLTDLRLYTGHVYPTRSKDQAFVDAASAMTKVLYAWWLQMDVDWAFEMTVLYGLLSTGYAQIPWNPRASHGLGNFEMRPYGMDRVMPIGPPGKLQEAEAIVFEEPRSLRWFRESFKLKGHLVDPDRELAAFGGARNKAIASLDTMSAGMRRLLGGANKPTGGNMPYSPYREFWTRDPSVNELEVPVIVGELGTPWCYAVMPGDPLYPRGRLTRRGGGVILDDGPNPYLDGSFPYVDLKLYEVPWLLHGMTELRSWIPGQDIVNQLAAGFLTQIRKAQNPPFLIPKGSISPGDIANLDTGRAGTKVEYNAALSPQPPSWQRTPPPTNVIPVVNLVLQELDRTSGQGAAERVLAKQQLPAGEAFDRLRQARSKPLQRQEKTEERFIRRGAELAIARMCQYYTEDRLFYLGASGASPLLHWQASTLRNLPVLSKDDEGRLKERKARIDERWRYTLQPRIVEDLQLMDQRAERVAATIREFAFYIKPNSLFDLERPNRVAIAIGLRRQKDLSLRGLYEELGVERDSETELAQIIKEQKEFELAGLSTAAPKKSGGHTQTGTAKGPSGTPKT